MAGSRLLWLAFVRPVIDHAFNYLLDVVEENYLLAEAKTGLKVGSIGCGSWGWYNYGAHRIVALSGRAELIISGQRLWFFFFRGCTPHFPIQAKKVPVISSIFDFGAFSVPMCWWCVYTGVFLLRANRSHQSGAVIRKQYYPGPVGACQIVQRRQEALFACFAFCLGI